MADQIESLLHRRTDLSTFLIHLTRRQDGQSARKNLLSILSDKKIEARSCYGMAKEWAAVDDDVADTQLSVCFSEAPLEHAWMLTREIEGRGVELSEYGLVFTKSFGRRQGVNPVWYLDITRGHDWLTNPINSLVEIARRGKSFAIASSPPAVDGPLVRPSSKAEDPILALTPFLEQMGPTAFAQKEFWWEREWRHVGDFHFAWRRHVVAVLAPLAKHDGLIAALADSEGRDEEWVNSRLRFVDPGWGLERMIAALAGVDEEDAGPLPSY